VAEFVKAKIDTYMISMHDLEKETQVKSGTKMFHITSDKQTRYLEPDEICIYSQEYGLNFGYKGDWEEYASV
jgi:hypothetical protein